MANIFCLIKEKGLASTLKKVNRRIFIKDTEVISILSRLGAYDYLQKYKYVLDYPIEEDIHFINPYPNKIWVCWLQGIENAPLIVQECVKSIRSYYPEDVILLNTINIKEYIDIPEFIIQKWKSGCMTHTHFSDILRIFLLAKYGGVWIDSTTYLLDRLPEYIYNAELFCFKANTVGNLLASSWFFVVKPNHPVIVKMKNLFLEYWKKENKLISYSLIHLFFTLSVESTDETKEMWQKVPVFLDGNCKLLQEELFNDYNEIRLEQIKHASVIQKLSYKFSEQDFEKKGTFYNKIFKQ